MQDKSIKIFVILGTQRFPFDRLIAALENVVSFGLYSKEEILIQSACPKYKVYNNLNFVQWLSSEKFNKLLTDSEIIITHAGTNSIISCMALEKHFIIAPRLKKYGEHVDNHQVEIAQVMKEKYNVLVVDELDKLPVLLEQVVTHKYQLWTFENSHLVDSIKEFINNV